MKSKPKTTVALSGIAACLLGGCVGSGDKYPSLEIRDAERITFAANPASQPDQGEVAPLAQMTADLPSILDRARAGGQAFDAAVPSARSAVLAARGTTPDNNNWARAQIALADLATHRTQVAIALSDADLLYAKAISESYRRGEIETLRQTIEAQLNAHDRVLAELDGYSR
ncbi:MAG: hypothetical protein ABJP48_03140 [Erythrobacter sp.]